MLKENNVFVFKEINGTWYGWSTPASATAEDAKNSNRRKLKIENADMFAPTEEKLRYHMLEGAPETPEHGVVSDTLIDGTPIDFVK